MTDNNKDFWDLSEYAKSRQRNPAHGKPFSKEATSAVEISDISPSDDTVASSHNESENRITRFVPPHKSGARSKNIILKEYNHPNPLIESVRLISDKENDSVFPETNLFIREREALLKKTGVECPYAPYYSYSPRYSQMSRAQLKWYLWWRENIRNGVFLKTDDSYITLYIYELASANGDEDKQEALNMLCKLMQECAVSKSNVVLGMVIRDVICDFCLVHRLPAPIEMLTDLDEQIFTGAYLPEFFVDLSKEKRSTSIKNTLRILSLYDYRRSKLFTPETADLFKNSIEGALAAMINDENAYNALLSFTEGVYGCVTAVHKPFTRMMNIVNRSVKLEIKYYQLSNVQSLITDAARYAENKLRDHMGVKSKLNILAINPFAKKAIDEFFDSNYPAMSIPDRRKRSHAAKEAAEVHEYDKLYDVPKVEFSAEHALEIERDSWSTTKILTEAFNDAPETTPISESSSQDKVFDTHIQSQSKPDEVPISDPVITTFTDFSQVKNTDVSETASNIISALGERSGLIALCKSGSILEQRKFALSLKLSLDELADSINEVAVDIFGDIILENDGEAYRIIEDYQDLF